MDWLVCLLIGIASGVAGGVFGIGGGIIMVPALVFLLKMPQQRAQGTSLAALLLPIGALGAWEYWKVGAVDLKAAAFVVVGFVFGVFGGAKIAVGLDELTMRRVFACFLVLVAAYLLVKKP